MAFMGELQQGAIGADGDDPQGDRLAASSQSSVGGVLQPAAAGDLHAQQGDALDGIGRENGGEPFGVVVGIQLGTADEGDAPLHEVPVEISIGVGGAIGGDEQVRAGKAGRPGGDQADLAGPLGQLRGLGGGRSCSRCGLLAVKLAHGAARAAVEDGLFGSGSSLFLFADVRVCSYFWGASKAIAVAPAAASTLFREMGATS